MKTIRNLARKLLIASAAIFLPAAIYAADTEIFYSKAQADNNQNQPIANLMILVDTSGSMKWCESNLGDGGAWCNNPAKRRINMLQDALYTMLDNVPDGVRIGLGRFDGGGGKVLIPTVDVTPAVRTVFNAEINALNAAGNSASAGSSASPSGGTPTDRAYAEIARYMMGMTPEYDSTSDKALCFEWAERDIEDQCIMVNDGWTAWQQIPSPGTCSPVNPSGACKVEYGEPVVELPAGDTCDTNLPDCTVEMTDWSAWTSTACNLNNEETCKRRASGFTPGTGNGSECSSGGCQWSNWSDWAEVGTNINACESNNTPVYQERKQSKTVYQGWTAQTVRWCEARSRTYNVIAYEYSTRTASKYLQQTATYFEREEVLRKECAKETYCAQPGPIKSGSKYVSPMNMANQCESNHVLIFTDGSPNGEVEDQEFVSCSSGSSVSKSYACQKKISSYLSDEVNNLKKREVKTYNIGLYMGGNKANMESVSTDGADGTYNAEDAAELAQAFAEIVNLVRDNGRSFSAPGVAVNQMNRLEHLDQLYYAVFEPKKSSYWEGNLKRYRVVDQKIRATNGLAVDPDTGYFSETSKSFWSDEVDGADVRKGGARAEVSGRKLFYSDAAGDTKQLDWDTDSTPAFYGLPATASAEDVTKLKDMLKVSWGDPLHSEPVLVNYGTTSGNNRIFVSGNDGMLRAINSADGTEKWAFMPHEMISKANQFTINQPGLTLNNDRQTYGLDGSWTAWRRPGTNVTSAPSKVYLYGGMRRGGYSYYALDVTDNSPELKWQIDRGDSGFERLGQTWSQPTLVQVMVGGSKRPALVFGGGYDPAGHDGKQAAARSAGDSMGNAIYVVDALTGSLIWSAGANEAGANKTAVAAMKWSVPSAISVVDLNFDGVADFFYFSDLGGQVFRVDLHQTEVTSSAVRRVANLSGSGVANNRRFYYAPSISYVKSKDGTQEHLYISIGSGYRTHPLSENTNDYFYVIRDDSVQRSGGKWVGSAPASLVTPSSLATLTSSSAADATKPGWKLLLADDGEKALSEAVVFNNRVFFTSYAPTTQDGDDCVVRIGTAYLYVVDIITGYGVDPGNIGTIDTPRRKKLKQDIPPPSATMLSDGSELVVIIGTEVITGESLGNTGVRRGSWYQLQPGEPDKVPKP